MTDGTTVFSGKEKKYDKNRPHYPETLMTFLYAEVGFRADSAIADIGIGTGIFSKQLSDRGSTVFCVEPNPDMRSIAEEKLSSYANVTFTDGDCKDTKLAAHSVDFITAAQAFHWFDVEAFRRESLRILKPKGRMVLVWNRRDETLVLLSHKEPDSHISVNIEFGEGEGQISLKEVEKRAEARKPKEKVTYKMIQQYIEENYDFKVHTAYIAEVKRSLGLPMYDAPNVVEELKHPRPHPT